MGVVAILVAVAGCAEPADDGAAQSDGESDALVSSAVVVADSTATSLAEVSADRVRLPLSVADRYRSLAVGSVFVGARGAPNGKNPDGFLRHVSSVNVEHDVDGDALVIATTPATLTDAIVHGALRTSNGGVAIDGDGLATQTLGGGGVSPQARQALSGIAVDFADAPLFDGVDVVEVGGKKTRFVESIRLEHAALTARPIVEVDLRIHDGKVSRFIAKVEGNLDTSVLASAIVTAEGDVDAQALAELRTRQHEVKRVVYQSSRVALPTIDVGGVPVSPSVQFTVTLRCSLAFGGPLVAHAGVEAKSYVRLGAVYDGAAWQPPITSDFDIKPAFALTHGGEIDARCAIVADAQLFAYGASSITMSVAPYVDFGVQRSAIVPVEPAAPSYRFRVGAGAKGSMQGAANVFGVRPEDLDRSLAEWKAPAILEGVAH